MELLDEYLKGEQDLTYDEIIKEVGIVDMAPYRVKNINNFYFRNHPEKLNPFTPKYKKYWAEVGKYSMEGRWIDDEGTWYWMPGKSYFLCNYLIIEDKKKNPIHPKFRDLERIIGRYFVCADGFSGFSEDDKYTCHHLIGRIEEGEELEDVLLKKIPENCKTKDGSWKKYVSPWQYLMRTYLIDDNRGKPLGRALWDNPVQNMMILGGRFTSKSTYAFIADFLHEWFFCGVKYAENAKDTRRTRLFGMASSDSAAINRSLAAITGVLTRLPGSYTFPKVGKETAKRYKSPFWKNYNSSFAIGNTVTHIEKDKSQNITHTGAMVQMRVITPDKTKIFTGARLERIYIEEVGFVEQISEIHSNQKDTLQLFGERLGSAVYLGTSGEIKAFRQVNELFNRPRTYDIQPIPNYWIESDKEIGLFLPAYYTSRDYADENENVDIIRSYNAKVKYRAEYRKTASSLAYDKEVMYHPLEPKEMIRPSGDSVLPKQEAQEALDRMEAFDTFKKRAMVGELEYDSKYLNGVKFNIDLEGKLEPILSYSVKDLTTTTGAFIQYEIPTPKAPKNMYWVIYDPAAQSGTGTSLHSVLVYKYSFAGGGEDLEDTIVAEWIGRLPTLHENWGMVIKIAKYFNAMIFPEMNTPGFIDWCKDHKHFRLLQSENVKLRKELYPKTKMDGWKKGFHMSTRAKGWALNKLSDYLMEEREWDEHGIPTKRNIDFIYSQRLLEEIVAYDPDGNYDHMSSALGWMVLLNFLSNIDPPKSEDVYADSDFIYQAIDRPEYVTTHTRKTRGRLSNCKLLNF